MESYEENRRPEEIERDIERTRSQMAGTLDDIQRQFSPGQMVDQALGYINEKSGQVGHQIMDTIRDNPVPVTLIGVGLAWLATSGWTGSSGSTEYRGGSRYSSRYAGRGARVYGGESYGAGSGMRSRSMAGTVGYGGGYGSSGPEHSLGERAFTERRIRSERRHNGSAGVAGAAWTGPNGEPDRRHGERRVRHMGQRMGQGMEHMGQRIGETIGEARHGMGEAMDTMKQKASETAGEMREKAGQVLGQVRETASEWTDQAREKTHELTEEAREQAQWIGQKIQDQTRYIIEEQPLALAALGIAIGAAIGATLPRTRQEDRLMGPARDELLHRADETGGELIHQAREQVKSGVESLASGMGSGQQGTTSAGSSPGAIQSGQTGTTGVGGTGASRPNVGGERIPTTPGGGSETRRP
jgi:ElaB/YqjD/DUF883 family membrane-anchored ribosome-binding protein